MAETKNPYVIPGRIDADTSTAEVAQRNLDYIAAGREQVKQAEAEREQERVARVERGVAEASRPPRVEEDDDQEISDDDANEASAALDRYLAPVQGAARNLDSIGSINKYKRAPAQPILSLTDEEIERKRNNGAAAFDVYKSIYDDVDGDRELLRARILNREDDRVKALAADPDALQAVVELVEDEVEPYSWTYRNIYKRLGAPKEDDDESVAQLREEYAASRAARALRLGPNQTAFTEQISVFMPQSIAEVDLTATQRELIDAYRTKLYTDAAFRADQGLTSEDRSVIETEAVRLATEDIEGAMSKLGRPRIYSMTADKTPYEMANENAPTGGNLVDRATARVTNGISASILEAKLRPRYMKLPTEAGSTEAALIGGANTLMTFGQVLMAIDPTEWVGTAMDVAAREYKRSVAAEEGEDGEVDTGDVLLSAAKAAAAGNYSMYMQQTFPASVEAVDMALSAVEPEALGEWRDQIIRDTIIASGDNEDLFDAATGALPTFVAAANRAVTGENQEPEIRKWFLENQMAAKTVLFAGAVAVPSVPMFDVLGGIGNKLIPGVRRTKAAPEEIASKIEKELANLADDAEFDVDRLVTDLGNSHGVGVGAGARAFIQSAAANAAERDVELLSREVDSLFDATSTASAKLLREKEAAAQRGRMERASALDEVLQQADLSDNIVSDLQQTAVSAEFRQIRDPLDTAAVSAQQAQAASKTWSALETWQEALKDGDIDNVFDMQRLAKNMDAVLEESDKTREALDATLHNLGIDIAAAEARLTGGATDAIVEVSRAEKALARGFARLDEMKKNNPDAAAILDGVVAHAKSLKNQEALRRRLRTLRQQGPSQSDITRPRADVEARIAALKAQEATGRLGLELRAEKVTLEDSLRLAPADATDVRMFSIDVVQTINALKQNGAQVRLTAKALEDLKVKNSTLYAKASGIINQDMVPAAKVLADVDKTAAAGAARVAQKALSDLLKSRGRLERLYGKLDAVDAFVVLKSRDKYRNITRRVKLKDSVLDEITRRRSAALGRALVIARRRAMAKAAPDARSAAKTAYEDAVKKLNAATKRMPSEVKAAGAQRLRAAQRLALLDFAKSLRRGAAEARRRGIRAKSMTYRTGLPEEDLTIIDRARNAMDAALGQNNVFGKAVEKEQFVDLVRRSVGAVQDDIVKYMDDVEDVVRVAEREAPQYLSEITPTALQSADSRRAILNKLVEAYAEKQWIAFSSAGQGVKVENLRQAVTEAVDVAMQTRRAQRDLTATLVVQQSTWARQGAAYAIYKLFEPRTGFIGEGSDQAWRVYQHADQTSAGFQAWLVMQSSAAIQAIIKQGGKYTSSELAQRMIDTVSAAFDSTEGLSRLGLPVDIHTPFQVAKRFFTERTPSAHSPTLTAEAAAVKATTEVVEINKKIDKLTEQQAKIVRARAENRLNMIRRKDKVAEAKAALDVKQKELASLQKEGADNAAAAAEATARRAEVQAEIAALEASLDAPPPAILTAAVEEADDVLSRLADDLAAAKARAEKIDADIAARTDAVAPKLTPRQRADKALVIAEKERELVVLQNQEGRVKAKWEEDAKKAAAAKSVLLGGDKDTPPAPILSKMQAALYSGMTAEQIVRLALKEAETTPWSAANKVRAAIDPTSSGTQGGFAASVESQLDAALADLAGQPDGKALWRNTNKSVEKWYDRLALADLEKPLPTRTALVGVVDKAKTVADLRAVLSAWKKKAAAYNKNKQETIDRVFSYLQRNQEPEAFEASDAYRRWQGEIFDKQEEISRLRASLDTKRRATDVDLQRLQSEKNTVANEVKSLQGKVQAQRTKVRSLQAGNVNSLKSDAFDAYRKAQKVAIDEAKERVKTLTATIGQHQARAKTDLTPLSEEVARRSKVLADVEAALATAEARSLDSDKALAAVGKEMDAARQQIKEITDRSASLTPADVRSALDEGAFEESALSVFDKMILNMGRSVFRGIQATNVSESEANRILYAIALDSIKKAENFADLHKRIKDGILGRFKGSRVVDERAPRTVNALAASMIQGIVSEYTTQYALREGLAVVQKDAARSFNALFNRQIANSSSNGFDVIRDMYATFDEVLRVGARMGRSTEGRSTLFGVDRRTGVDMQLVEAAKLPGFAGGVWVPENVFKTALEDLESYARQMDVLVSTAPAEVGNWLLDKGKKLFSIWRTKVLVGYLINKLGYRTRAILGDIGSAAMVLGPREALRLAAVSVPNALPFVREGAIKATAAAGKVPKAVLDSLVATSTAIKNGTDPVRLLAPGTWRNLPRRSVSALLDSVAVVPRALMGLAPINVSKLLHGNPQDLLKLGSTEQTTAQWWSEMRLEGILDNNVQINLRTGLKQNTEIWADLTARRYSWFAVERRYRELRKTTPDITRDEVRQMLEASNEARPLSIAKRIKYALMRHQESLEKTEAEVHVTTRVALYASLREKGLTAKEAADGVKAAVYDWNYGANRAALNMLAFVPFGRFHVLRQQQGIDALNLMGDTSPWRSIGNGPSGALRRADLMHRYLASVTGFDIPTEAELDTYLADARGYGATMAEEWGMSPAEAATTAQQETLDFLLSAWWARSHSPDYMANRQYFYEFISPEQQKAFQAAYGTPAGNTLAMTSNVPPLGTMDAFDVLATGAALAEISIAYMNGEDKVAENAMSKLATPWFEKLPDVAKAAVAVLSGKAGLELDAIEQGRHTPQMLASAKPAEALLLNALGYAPVTLGVSDQPIRELLTTTRGDDDRPRVVGFYSKSLLALMRMDPFITPHLTKTIDAAAYKNPKFGQDWDAIRATYTFTNLVGLTSYNVTDPMREAKFDVKDVQQELMKKKQTAEGKAAQGERALNARKP